MSHTHEFPASEDIEDNICEHDRIESITYVGSVERVMCSKESDESLRDDLEKLSRADLYTMAGRRNIDVYWSGDDADTRETMITKILEHHGE
jgi:hypothetical protein